MQVQHYDIYLSFRKILPFRMLRCEIPNVGREVLPPETTISQTQANRKCQREVPYRERGAWARWGPRDPAWEKMKTTKDSKRLRLPLSGWLACWVFCQKNKRPKKRRCTPWPSSSETAIYQQKIGDKEE